MGEEGREEALHAARLPRLGHDYVGPHPAGQPFLPPSDGELRPQASSSSSTQAADRDVALLGVVCTFSPLSALVN